MTIKFGPSGLGGVKEAIKNLEKFKSLGLQACEIAFTYGAYIKTEKDAKEIGEAAKRLGIQLSIHAPYWINLNSEEEEKVEKSKQRILESLRVGTWLGAYRVVFHPGYYGKMGKEETFQNIKREILELERIRKENNYTPKLAPETTGKINVFGNIQEIKQLTEQTGCEFCIDFAHILAREKKVDYDLIKKSFPQKDWHCHFSGIEYGEKGEKKHKKTEKREWEQLIENLPKNTNMIVINESPYNVEDSVLGLNVLEELKQRR